MHIVESYLRVMCRNRRYNKLRQLRREAGKNKKVTLGWRDESNETEETILLNEAKSLLDMAISKLPA